MIHRRNVNMLGEIGRKVKGRGETGVVIAILGHTPLEISCLAFRV